MKKYKSPLYGCIDLTYDCNLSCKHCVFINNDISEKKLTTKEVKHILDDFEEKKLIGVQLSGGEPLLRKDFIEILQYASKKKYAVSIATNGTLINDSIIEEFKKCNVKNVQLSIDGFEKSNDFLRGEGTFKKITNILDKLVNEDIPVSIVTMITKQNINEIEYMLKYLKDIKILYWRLQYILGNKIMDSLNIFDYINVYEKIKKIIDADKLPINIMMPCYIHEKNPKQSCDNLLINITEDGSISNCFFNNTQNYEFVSLKSLSKEVNYQFENDYYICSKALD
ncbi:MAG: radical SAM protein [Defluviitaleaceae bacterium]|nr:radical SAM protein [Defluviitaleaceae bacterium]